MHLVSINIGKAEQIGGPGTPKFYSGVSGINKRAVEGTVFISKLGLTNDTICNPKFHGGADQAVYIYSRDDYVYFEDLLQTSCPNGLFGENFTVTGLSSAQAYVGDQYRFGELLVEVTSPRIPCATFSAKMNDKKFARTFMMANRPGIYCRVLDEGNVQAGTAGIVQAYKGTKVSLQELFEAYPYKKITDEQRVRFNSVPLHWKALAFLKGERDTPA